jgi:hypothetical protein
MPKNTESSSVTTQAEPESKQKTEWDTFVDNSGLGVSRIICETLPGHPGDEACKTKLPLKAENIIEHLKLGHGGGFRLTLRDGGETWPGWAKLRDAGIYLHFILDEVTNHEVDPDIRKIRNLLKPHTGKFRGAYQAFKNQFLFSLNTYRPGEEPKFNDDYEE